MPKLDRLLYIKQKLLSQKAAIEKTRKILIKLEREISRLLQKKQQQQQPKQQTTKNNPQRKERDEDED